MPYINHINNFISLDFFYNKIERESVLCIIKCVMCKLMCVMNSDELLLLCIAVD